MKTLSGMLGVILVGIAVFGHTEVFGADWIKLGANPNGVYFYDRSSITHPSKNIVTVSIKLDYSKAGVMDLSKQFPGRYSNLHHSIFENEIDCPKKKMRFLSIRAYSKTDDVIDEHLGAGEWLPIRPTSFNEWVYNAVCK